MFNIEMHKKLCSVMTRTQKHNIPKYGIVSDVNITARTVEYCVGCHEWYSVYISDILVKLKPKDEEVRQYILTESGKYTSKVYPYGEAINNSVGVHCNKG